MAKTKVVKQGKLATRIAAVVIAVLIISMTILVVLLHLLQEMLWSNPQKLE